jgi:hypothetical protein
MSARRLVLVGALLGIPALATAQRRPTSGGSGTYGGSKAVGQSKLEGTRIRKEMFSTKDLEKENMVAFVLDKKKDLKLSDDEVKALKDINQQLKDTLRTPMKALDSIADKMRRQDEGAPDQDERNSARIFAQSYIAEVHTQYDNYLKLALAKLTDDHQKPANDVIESRRKELAPQPEKPER